MTEIELLQQIEEHRADLYASMTGQEHRLGSKIEMLRKQNKELKLALEDINSWGSKQRPLQDITLGRILDVAKAALEGK